MHKYIRSAFRQNATDELATVFGMYSSNSATYNEKSIRKIIMISYFNCSIFALNFDWEHICKLPRSKLQNLKYSPLF